ncbi:MAG TPA: hypothetical protein VJI68_00730 [Candidatus Nanoarchaeia archaeon]|nr:hypothetical protein [Candidatus Nanoarchaeia archaeon]
MRYKYLLSFIIIFLISISAVSAVQVNTQSISESLCPRETGSFTHTIKNDGSSVKEYTVELRGSAAQWATAVPQGFILNSGEEKNLFTYVTPSQSARAGNYNLDIVVSGVGETKTVSHNVIVDNCYGANILPIPSNGINTCPNKPVKYTVRVTNTGEYSENFKFSVSGSVKERTTLSQNSFILSKGETRDLLLFVNAPNDAGEYDFSLLVESDSGRVKESLSLFLNVNPCYQYTLEVLGNVTHNVCEKTFISVPLRLSNKGTTSNTFDLQVDGPQWAKMERSQITLNEGEVKTISLFMAPAYGTVGEYDIKISAVPEQGDLKAEAEFSVNVRRCRGISIDIKDEKADVCKGSSNEYEVVLNNEGEVNDVFRIDVVEGPEWLSFKPERLYTVNAKSQKSFTLVASPSSDVIETDYKVTLKTSTTDRTSDSIYDTDTIKLEVKDPNSCYRSSISTPEEDLIVYYDSSVPVPVEITNRGLRKADFNLALSGSAAKFSRLNPSAVSIEAGKTEIIYLYIAPSPQIEVGKYDAKVSVNLKNGPLVNSQDFNIEITDVKERANTGNNTVNGTDTGVRPLGPSLDFVKRNWYYFVGGLALLIIIILIIIFRKSIANFYTEDSEETTVKIEREEVKDSEQKTVAKKKKVVKKKVTTEKTDEAEDIKKGV